MPSGTKRRTPGRRGEAADPAGAAGPCLDPLPVLRGVLGAGPDALPGEAADHGSQHLGDRGGVDLQRVRCSDGADPRRRAPGHWRAPLVVGLVVSHPTVGPGRSVSGRRGPERRRRPRPGRTGPPSLRASLGPRLVHMPSEPSGSQWSPAVSSGASVAQVAGLFLGNRPSGRTLIRMRSAGPRWVRTTPGQLVIAVGTSGHDR